MTEFWKSLKSGTDIRGVAMEGVEGEPLTLTDEVVERIGTAFAVWLEKQCGKPAPRISVGRDSRLSGERMRDAVIRGLTRAGAQVLECGLCSTPAMFMTTVDLGCDGAVQITASHHPWQRNGLKFFRPSGGLESEDISALLETAEQNTPVSPAAPGTVTATEYMPRYAAHLRRMICDGLNAAETDRPLTGLHLVVDAGNGVGGFYASDVLAPLGADIRGSRYLEPDGRFPNHIPNPENEEAMRSICEAVTVSQADFGIIFDTDVDRAGCVDARGREINRNRLIALASAIVLEKHPGGTVVTDSVTSDGLKEFIEGTLGGKHRRFKRGYKNVINEAIRLNREGIDAPLAIETSGHAALRDNYFLDDGAYLATRILITVARLRAEGRTVEDLIGALREPAEAEEIRFAITEPDFRAYGDTVLDGLGQYAEDKGWRVADDSYEGVRISFDGETGSGWALLRLSVHDPVMPLNIESNVPGGCAQIERQILPYLASFPALRRK